MHRGFWWGSLTERDQMEDLGVEMEIILKLIFKKWDGGVDWFDLG